MGMARIKINPSFITDLDGKQTAAVLDIREFRRICDLLEDQLDLAALNAAEAKSTGTTPWREMLDRVEAKKSKRIAS
jgi:hypothetical protein